MPRGDGSRYTPRQRTARHIEHSYGSRGLDAAEAGARAWASVSWQSGGGECSGSGRKSRAARKAKTRAPPVRRALAPQCGHSPTHGRPSTRRTGLPCARGARQQGTKGCACALRPP